MKGICLVCGERMTTKLCDCGFDFSKYYDYVRTLCVIQPSVLSAYEMRKNFDRELVGHATTNVVNNNHNNCEQIYKAGLKCYKGDGIEKDYIKAFALFEEAANKGSVEAMNYLGDMYCFGEGVKRDFDKSKEWCRKAALLGDKIAKSKLERRFGIKLEDEDAKCINSNKQKDSVDSDGGVQKLKAGLRYFKGEGVSKDLTKAFGLFQEAANAGNVEAMSYLGDMYCFGEGVERDFEKSKEWSKKAALLGDVMSKNKLERRFNIKIETLKND